jgi:hypothetical protein
MTGLARASGWCPASSSESARSLWELETKHVGEQPEKFSQRDDFLASKSKNHTFSRKRASLIRVVGDPFDSGAS